MGKSAERATPPCYPRRVPLTIRPCGAPEARHNPDEVAALLAAGTPLWIDAEGDDGGIAALLTDTLKLHPLAVEDILRDRPSPKVEDYGDYLYVVVHGIVRGADPESLETVEIDLVLARQFIFTHHRGPSRSVAGAAEDLTRNPQAGQRGPAWVAHAILDHLVDYYLPVVDALDDDIDAVEHRVVEDPSRAVLQHLFKLKRALQRLRRVSVYQREVLHRLSRGEFAVVPPAALPFYRDVYDHFVRVADLADSYREQLSGALEAYLSVVSNRMNEVMKTLTIVATLILPLTLIVGVYGMNFDRIPELHWKYGYLYCWVLMISVAAGMLAWFRHRRWL
jgi:magnesium transporter